MAKMTGAQGKKICGILREACGDAAADDFAAKLPLSSSADFTRKLRWAKGVCEYFDAHFTPEKVMELRMSCSCVPPEGKMYTAKALYSAAASPEEFSGAFNREYAPENSVWYGDGSYYFSYPQCYCSVVKRSPEPLPATWCLCTLGYAKRLFDFILERDTEVELIESVKTGGSRCVMKITVR